MLRESQIAHVVQLASWMEGTSVLAKLTKYAPQIRSLTISRDAAGDLAILSEFVNVESLTLSQPGKGIAYAEFAHLH